MTDETTLPLYLRGRFAPVPEEHSAADLIVRGSLPPDLDGRYLRNGPNPLPGEDTGHWFTGPGMLHGVRLRGGRAAWYRNRWVRTRELDGHPFLRADASVDLAATPANTHVIRHAGTVLALCEAGLPYWVTPSLETVGPYDFEGRLTTAMTAHPKEDPATGGLHLFGTGFTPPYLTYHRVTAEGLLLDSRPVDVPGPTMMHDFAVTEHHIVWMDLPVVLDPALAGRGGMPYRWNETYGARLGVMSRSPGSTDVRWYAIDPCYIFHVGNAHEDVQGRIVLDAVRYDRAGFHRTWTDIGGPSAVGEPGLAAPHRAPSVLHRWTLDPATGQVTEAQLDDRAAEYPTHNGWAAAIVPEVLLVRGAAAQSSSVKATRTWPMVQQCRRRRGRAVRGCSRRRGRRRRCRRTQLSGLHAAHHPCRGAATAARTIGLCAASASAWGPTTRHNGEPACEMSAVCACR